MIGSRQTMTLVVHTRNRPADVRRCLASIKSQTIKPNTVMIVENIREKQWFSKKIMRSLLHPSIQCIYRRTKARNVAYSRNISLTSVLRGLLVSIDDDSIFATPKVLERITMLHKQYPHIGCFVGSVQSTGSSIYEQFSVAIHMRESRFASNIAYVDTFPSACYALNISCIAGSSVKFDTALNTGEDIDYFWRLSQKGILIAFHPTISVITQFPNDLRNFMQKQISYAKNFTDIFKSTDGRIDHISWIMPQRKLHLVCYPVLLVGRILSTSIFLLHDIQFDLRFLPLAIVQRITTLIGVFTSQKGKAAFSDQVRQILQRPMGLLI